MTFLSTRSAGYFAIVCLLTTACVGVTPRADTPARTSAAEEPGGELARAATPVAASTATPVPRPQHLRLPLTEPPTLDPSLATDNASIDIVVQLFEGLVAFDAQGAAVGLGAESWDVSDDGLTYTFGLRHDARWSDGKPVVAEHYVWSWQRALDPSTAADYATTLYPVKNAQRIHRQGLDPRQLGVEAPGERTLVVTLEQPNAAFLRLASTWTMVPLRQDVIALHGDRWTDPANIVTNGPFRLVAWRHDSQVALQSRRDYWAGPPRLEQVTYRIFPEGAHEQVLAAYEAGELDTLGPGTAFEIPSAQMERLLADSKLRDELRTFPQSATMFITINHRRPHFQDPRVRQALGQVIDRQRLLDQVLRRTGVPATGLQPEGIPGREPSAWPWESVEEARRKLAEAGFPEGEGFPEITFTYNASPQWKLLAEYLQQRYKDALGITLKLEPMEWAAFMRWRRGDDWQRAGDLYRGGWFSDYEDPSNWYNLLWDSREDRGVFNSGWRHDEFDRQVREARGASDPARREDLYREAEQILADEYPSIPVFHYSVRTLVKPYVENFAPQRVLGLTPLRDTYLNDSR